MATPDMQPERRALKPERQPEFDVLAQCKLALSLARINATTAGQSDVSNTILDTAHRLRNETHKPQRVLQGCYEFLALMYTDGAGQDQIGEARNLLEQALQERLDALEAGTENEVQPVGITSMPAARVTKMTGNTPASTTTLLAQVSSRAEAHLERTPEQAEASCLGELTHALRDALQEQNPQVMATEVMNHCCSIMNRYARNPQWGEEMYSQIRGLYQTLSRFTASSPNDARLSSLEAEQAVTLLLSAIDARIGALSETTPAAPVDSLTGEELLTGPARSCRDPFASFALEQLLEPVRAGEPSLLDAFREVPPDLLRTPESRAAEASYLIDLHRKLGILSPESESYAQDLGDLCKEAEQQYERNNGSNNWDQTMCAAIRALQEQASLHQAGEDIGGLIAGAGALLREIQLQIAVLQELADVAHPTSAVALKENLLTEDEFLHQLELQLGNAKSWMSRGYQRQDINRILENIKNRRRQICTRE